MKIQAQVIGDFDIWKWGSLKARSEREEIQRGREHILGIGHV